MDAAALASLLLDQLTDGKNLVSFIVNTDKKGVAQQTLTYLNSRLSLPETYWKEIYTRNRTLCQHESALKEETYFKEMMFSTYEFSYSQNKSELLDHIQAKAPPQPASAHSSLPRISLPKFSGKQADWETFKEQFTVLVSNDTSLSSVVKLFHLQSSIQGAVAQRVNRLPELGSNFTVGWNILVKRYDNPRTRITTHMRKLLSMPVCSKKSVDKISRLLDGVAEATRAFTLLGRPVDQWDDWFVEIITSRLDTSTKEDWGKSNEDSEELPSYAELTTFLERRVRTLEASLPDEVAHDESKVTPNTIKKNQTVSAHVATTSNSNGARQGQQQTCIQCSQKHFLAYCPTFLSWDTSQRRGFVKSSNLCYNCLRRGHAVTGCQSTGRCRVSQCGAQYHTFLHPSSNISPSTDNSLTTLNSLTTCIKNSLTSAKLSLLATATIILESPQGQSVTVRALVDPASEASFVTERVAQILSLHKTRMNAPISGVGGDPNLTSKAICEVVLKSKKESNFYLKFPALVLEKLTALLPRERCVPQPWQHLQGIELADPDFCEPSRIDCMLGADVYSIIIREGLRQGQAHEPVAQNTVLGWLITGPAPLQNAGLQARLSFFTTTSVVSSLQPFWEQEEIPSRKTRLSAEEEACEKHFVETYSRDESGRFVLRLPLAKEPDLPGSLDIAINRLLRSKKRFQAKPVHVQKYTNFMNEFMNLDHMEVIPEAEIKKDKVYYMTHHAIEKHNNSGHVRVVSNASQASKNGFSLNDYLYIGPKLQCDISAIISRWL